MRSTAPAAVARPAPPRRRGGPTKCRPRLARKPGGDKSWPSPSPKSAARAAALRTGPALLALVVAAAAGAASALWLADRSSANDQTVVATSPAASSFEQTQTAPEPTTAATTTQATPTAPGPPPPLPPSKTLVPWPAGRSGWTIVLDSLPSVNGRAPAVAEARQALHLGLKKVGVLDSAGFSSLHPGYYVVFFGIYSSQAAAQSSIIDAHQKGYGGAYPRRITP